MRYLFAIDEIESKNQNTLRLLRELKMDSEVVVLGLSTLADMSLRREDILYVTPDVFFSMEKSSEIDKRAYAISQMWHKLLDPDLISYRGVSIGEALEYDFYHLLVDTLRSIEIANTILKDSYDVVYLPSSGPSLDGRGISFHTVCYQTLPLIISDYARKRGMKVVRLSPSPDRRPTAARWRPRVLTDQGFMASGALFLLKNRRDLFALFSHKNLSRTSLQLCPICQNEIINCLRRTGGIGVKAFPGILQNRRSKVHASRLGNLMGDEKTVSRLDDEITYKDNHFWRALYPFADEVLSKLIPLIIGRINWAEFFVKVFNPTSFVVFQDITPLSRSMCQVLKNHGVYVFVIQHGILSNDMAGMYTLPKVGYMQAVWGEYYEEWHSRRGMPAGSLAVTGFPRHDKLVNMPPLNREDLCRRFDLDPGRKVALIATEWYQPVSARYTIEKQEEFIRFSLRSLKAYDDVQIVVKLHPAFQAKYRKIVSEIANQEGVNVVIAGDSLWDLIRLSSFVIVSLSSVTVEALILGKPVISVDLVDKKDISGLVQNGLAIGARNEDELNSAIRKCLENPESSLAPDGKREELLLPFTGPLDGQSSRRLAELVNRGEVGSDSALD
jgi:hypothetical protein